MDDPYAVLGIPATATLAQAEAVVQANGQPAPPPAIDVELPTTAGAVVFEAPGVRLVQAEALELLRSLPDASVETVFFDGPYLLAQIMLGAPMDIPLPVPGGGDTPIHVVPLDYVLDAGMAIAAHPDAAGRTFHLVDGRPVTVRRALELVATSCARPAPRIAVPTRWAAKLVRNTGLERLANVPRAFLEEISTEVIYDDTNTRELLSGTEIECPPFETYVDAIVGRVRRQRTAEREALEDQRAKAHSTV